MTTIYYEQPRLKKYGTMKELTLDQSGSGSDLNFNMEADMIAREVHEKIIKDKLLDTDSSIS